MRPLASSTSNYEYVLVLAKGGWKIVGLYEAWQGEGRLASSLWRMLYVLRACRIHPYHERIWAVQAGPSPIYLSFHAGHTAIRDIRNTRAGSSESLGAFGDAKRANAWDAACFKTKA
jgi:hypothetical protein